MPGLFYFVPELTLDRLAPREQLNLEVLRETELGAILADVRAFDDVAVIEMQRNTPADRPGIFVSPIDAKTRQPTRLFGYYKQEQEWTPAPCGRFWVGRIRGDGLFPDDFRRFGKLVPGHDLELCGQVWHVPVVRRPPNTTSLPREMYYDQNGRLASRIPARYRDLWDTLGDFADTVFGTRELAEGDEERFFAAAIDVLAINYRVGKATQNVLQTLDSDTWQSVLNLAIDVPFFEELASKKNSSE